MKGILQTLLAALVCSVSIVAVAADDCPSSNILSGRLLTDVCWDCLFPIVVGGMPIGGNLNDAPDKAADGAPACLCTDELGVADVGFSMGMWDPATLLEFTDNPGCSSVLNGVKFPFDNTNRGTTGIGTRTLSADPVNSFHHYHYYSFPLLSILDMYSGRGCSATGYSDLDVMFMSELDPTWNRDELAFFTTPEAVLVSNPIATASCAADAASASAGKPIDSMFWCAGAWGALYPLSGHQNHFTGIIDQTSLASAKLTAALHRRGLMRRTMGNDVMCGGEIDVFMPKSQYKYSLIYPVAETDKAHVIGESSLKWGYGKTIPGVASFPIYMSWQWLDCCVR